MRAVAVALVALSGCAPLPAGAPSPLDPRTEAAAHIAQLGWVMFALAAVVCIAVFGAVVYALFRSRPTKAGEPAAGVGGAGGAGGVGQPDGNQIVIIAGMALPGVVIAVTLGYTIVTLRDVAGEGGPGAAFESQAGAVHSHGGSGASGAAAGAGGLEVRIVGRQWWWDVVYPQAQVVTANEVRIPAGIPVRLLVTSQDVIHSFWIPQVAGKVDAIPGTTAAITVSVAQPGVYRGLCSEFCGLQHAHMHFHLFVEAPETFAAWLAAQQQVASPPAAATPAPGDTTGTQSIVAQGQRVFQTSGCAQCHTVRGTAASGTRGPDLTHVVSRRTLGAGTHENTPANLARWVTEPQEMKPGNKMPDPQLSEADARAVVAYLGTLE